MSRSTIKQHLTLTPNDPKRLDALRGDNNSHLKAIEQRFSIQIFVDDNNFELIGLPKSIRQAATLLTKLYEQTEFSCVLSDEDIHSTPHSKDEPMSATSCAIDFDMNALQAGQMKISPRTPNQSYYLNAIQNNDINFGIGPSGTGKTFLAVASAVQALDMGSVSRIILCRPAVEAGEQLGFLPGDLSEKISPYLQPLYDSLFSLYGINRVDQLIKKGVLEIASLAFMRGRTLTDSFVILDEAQNTTPQQMKMFLTRLGFGSKAVITGDITQTDLPHHQRSGLRDATQLLKDIPGIAFTFFKANDIVRHPLIQQIIEAYEDHDKERL